MEGKRERSVEAASVTTSRGSQGLSALHVVPAAPLRRAQLEDNLKKKPTLQDDFTRLMGFNRSEQYISRIPGEDTLSAGS